MAHLTSSTVFNLDDFEKDLLAATELSDAPFCCCTLLDDTLRPEEHLADCDLRLHRLTNATTVDAAETPTPSTTTDDDETREGNRRRKHRQTVARIRARLRTSINSLKAEEMQLQQQLRDHLAGTATTTRDSQPSAAVHRLRLAYLDLVREQIALEEERAQLETSQLLRERYERLVLRELDKARTFRTST